MVPAARSFWVYARLDARLRGRILRNQWVGQDHAAFVCHDCALVIELDTADAASRLASLEREARLRTIGYAVMRVAPGDILHHPHDVCDRVAGLFQLLGGKRAGRRAGSG